MPETNPQPAAAGGDEERVVLDARTLASLAPETMEKLRSEFGATIELRASKPGMASILESLTGRVTAGGIGAAAEYDRGFDRTSPGYDKYYDRDRTSLTTMEEVVRPAELDVRNLNRLFRR
jgi:hypothetical protein